MPRHFLLSAFILLACSTALGPSASAQSRHALVIGVDDYRNFPKLSRAVADARAMRNALQALGFRTRFAENPDRGAMSAAIAGFEEGLEKGGVAAIPSVIAPATPQPGPQAPPQAAVPAFEIGQRWQVREVSASGLLFDGIWTRTGPRSFAAEWRQVGSRDVIRDTIDIENHRGDAVVLYRRGLNGRYFGTLSADGRFVSGHASWYGAGDNWSAAIEKEETSASTGAQAKPPVPKIVVVPRLDPNASWHVREVTASGAAFDGVWTRTGAHTFTAEWHAAGSGNIIRDTIEIERQYGNVVVLSRQSIKGRYFGTISRDGRFIQGHASWCGPGDRWTVEIR